MVRMCSVLHVLSMRIGTLCAALQAPERIGSGHGSLCLTVSSSMGVCRAEELVAVLARSWYVDLTGEHGTMHVSSQTPSAIVACWW